MATPTRNPQSLEAAGFTQVSREAIRRLVISSQGLEKHGKSHFALTAPGPIAILNIDLGLEGVVERFVDEGKVIYQTNLMAPTPDAKMPPEALVAKYVPLWEEFTQRYHDGLRLAKTVVVDTMTEAWEMLRLARFGKLAQVLPQHYGPLNAEFIGLVNAAFFSKATVIFIHKEKDEYVANNRTGRTRFAGQSDIPYKAQLNLRHFRDEDDDEFKVEILNCRQNSALKGLVLAEPLNTLPYLASLVYPDTETTDWE